MEYQITELIDVEKNRHLLDSYFETVGITSTIIDLDGKVIVGSQWQRICKDYYCLTELSSSKCIERSTELVNKLSDGKKFFLHKCKNGLTYAASPIILEDEHIANAVIGQFLLEPPDSKNFRNQAQVYGFDENDFLKALSEVPVLEKEKLPSILDFLTTFAEIVGTMMLDHMRQLKAEYALSESEERFRLFFENSPDAVFLADAETGIILEANPTASTMMSMPREKIVGIHQSQLHPPSTQEYSERTFTEQIQQNKNNLPVLPIENVLIGSHGRETPVEVVARMITLGDKPVLMGVFRDITERKRAEEALHLTQFANDHSSVAAYWMGPDARFIYVNEASCHALGYSQEELLGLTVHDIDPDFPKEVWPDHWEDLRRRKSFVIETIHQKKSGETFPVEITVNYINFVGKEYNCAFARDITERKMAEEALRESEERHRQIVENTEAGYFFIDRNGLFQHVNDAWLQMHKYDSADEVIGKNFALAHVDAELEQAQKNVGTLLSGKPIPSGEFSRLCKDGSIAYHTFSANTVKYAGQVIGLEGFIIDTTESKQIENKLRKSEERFRQIAENIKEVFWLGSPDWDIIYYISPAYEQVWGLSCDSLYVNPLSWLEPVVQEDRDKVINDMNNRISGDFTNVITPEFRIIRPDGTVRWILARTFPISNEKGEIYRIAGIAEDITERKRAEDELYKMSTEQQIILDSVPAAIWYKDTKNRILRVNKVGADSVGMKIKDIEGKTAEELFPEEAAHYYEDDLVVMNSGKPKLGIEELLQVSSGEKRWVQTDKVPYWDEKDNIAGVIAIVVDITERKLMEEQLQIRERMDSLGTLAGGIAHDFNNILVGITGNIDMLRMESETFTTGQKEYLDEAFRSSLRAAKLIREIQTLSRGSLSEISSVDIYDVANDVFTILNRTTDRLIEKKNDIVPGTCNVTGRADQLHQVFLNLGTNAIHAIEEKGAQPGDYIRIKAVEHELKKNNMTSLPGGKYIHIFFEDTGTGMTDEVKRKAFDPLFTTRGRSSQKGQGLGLAMVYNIITMYHNGYISINTAIGKGTTIHIYLPIAPSDVTWETREKTDVVGGNETILVVEDEASIMKLVRTSLEKFGYSILTAANGQEGLDVYNTNRDTVDLVLLDLTMPVMSGEMFLERILEINPDVNVVLSSGHGEEVMQKYTETKGYVIKPYSIMNLARTIRNVLDMC